MNSNWLETLRIKLNPWESFLYLNREQLRAFFIQDMSYNHKQKRRIQAKFARKRCPPNQLNTKVYTENNKKSSFAIFLGNNICKSNDPHYCNTVKRKQKPTKNRQICKIQENWFYENWLFQEERPFEEKKPLWRANCISKNKWCELFIENLSNNLTEIKLTDHKIYLFFKNKYFHNS